MPYEVLRERLAHRLEPCRDLAADHRHAAHPGTLALCLLDGLRHTWDLRFRLSWAVRECVRGTCGRPAPTCEAIKRPHGAEPVFEEFGRSSRRRAIRPDRRRRAGSPGGPTVLPCPGERHSWPMSPVRSSFAPLGTTTGGTSPPSTSIVLRRTITASPGSPAPHGGPSGQGHGSEQSRPTGDRHRGTVPLPCAGDDARVRGVHRCLVRVGSAVRLVVLPDK